LTKLKRTARWLVSGLVIVALVTVCSVRPVRNFANENSGALTFILGLLVLGVYWRQTTLMSGQLGAAVAAAEAAKKAADVAEEALRIGERPYMLVSPVRDVLEYAITNANPTDPMLPFTAQPYVTIIIMNYGKTPAILREVGADLKISATLPTRGYFSKVLPQANTVIPTDRNVGGINCTAETWNADAHRAAIANGEQHFWLVGELKYDDIFGNVTVAGFCYRYYVATKSFHEDGGNKYNFQRTTKRGQD
jgi:hypothetical protein